MHCFWPFTSASLHFRGCLHSGLMPLHAGRGGAGVAGRDTWFAGVELAAGGRPDVPASMPSTSIGSASLDAAGSAAFVPAAVATAGADASSCALWGECACMGAACTGARTWTKLRTSCCNPSSLDCIPLLLAS
eukprot:scaffold97389_cov15-Tisochrysis_lutea.AAC.1